MNSILKRLLAFAAALVLCFTAVACGGEDAAEDEQEQASGTAVEVVTVERGDIFTETTVTGNVMANRNIPVMPPVAGTVGEVIVKAGDSVKEGDVLFTMDTEELRDTYAVLLDSYYSTKTLLDEQVRQTRQSVENLEVLFEMGAVSQNNLDQARLGLLQAETSRETTLAQLGADDVVDVINDPNVYATADGTISSVAVTSGVMASNTSVGVVISEIGKSQVIVNVAESLQPHIHVGDTVSVALSSYAQPVTGTVAAVASAVSQQTALYQVNIDLPADLKVSVGMFATVTFHTDARYDAVLVPTEAILTDGLEQYVFIVADDGCAYKISVTTGLIGETQTEITTGLDGGEALVTVGQSYLSDGAPVRIVEG